MRSRSRPSRPEVARAAALVVAALVLLATAALGGPGPRSASAATGPAAAVAAAPVTATPRAAPAAVRQDDLTRRGLPSRTAWRAATQRARRWAAAQPERIRFALRVEDRSWAFRGAERTNSNSVLKATVLVAYLRRGSVRDRPLTRRERALLEPMIRRSANGPVPPLIDAIGGLEPLRAVARRGGMRRFAPVRTPWGTSQITAADEVAFFAALPSLLPPRHRAYALELLRTIVPSQRWGLARAAPAGWLARFKGGWDDHGDVKQVMRLECADRVVVASVLVDGTDHERSIAAIERVGRRLLMPLRARGAEACSSVLAPAP
ncbi:hypothetical protein [Patulibacter americanus]|uniref:hypothetical protein n=1 Tax=Patulibacter americanus TaxID=588672 RepID=UPI0003B4A06B|nr:hypothetical protein [Patulibacter americanus]